MVRRYDEKKEFSWKIIPNSNTWIVIYGVS